jgi:hypothetical protein
MKSRQMKVRFNEMSVYVLLHFIDHHEHRNLLAVPRAAWDDMMSTTKTSIGKRRKAISFVRELINQMKKQEAI